MKDSLMKANIDYRGYSNYDKALKMYEENYMEKIDDETIIFVLGDARNNRNDARMKTFLNLSDRAKHVFWLNPEEKRKFDNKS
ncbi:hypothetical protein WH51_06465 [Bacilli bacterium VT-13-104]|nr:hypothetical protein WH51_06465 [Bacilli bacterium VT-13-104]